MTKVTSVLGVEVMSEVQVNNGPISHIARLIRDSLTDHVLVFIKQNARKLFP